MSNIDKLLNELGSIYGNEEGNRAELLNDKMEKLYDKDQVSYRLDAEMFFNELNFAVSKPFKEEGLAEEDPRKLAIVPYLFNGLCHHFFFTFIKKQEGVTCAGDKTAFVIRKIKEALRKGENISLQQNYSVNDLGGEKYQHVQGYWSPKCITDTDSAIEMFNK